MNQTAKHMVTTCPIKRVFSSSSFLFRLNKQAQLSRSLYSWADFCVSVCFNLNGFQVPSLPKSASLFSLFDPAADIEAPFLSSFVLTPSFSHFLSTLRRHHSVPSITLSSLLLFLPFLSHIFFLSLSPPLQKTQEPESLWISQCSPEANTPSALTARVQEVTMAASLCGLMGSDLP